MRLKDNKERADIAITLIWIVLIFEIVSVVSGYFQYDLLTSIANGEEVSDAKAELNDLREQLIAIVYGIVYITTAITFIN